MVRDESQFDRKLRPHTQWPRDRHISPRYLLVGRVVSLDVWLTNSELNTRRYRDGRTAELGLLRSRR